MITPLIVARRDGDGDADEPPPPPREIGITRCKFLFIERLRKISPASFFQSGRSSGHDHSGRFQAAKSEQESEIPRASERKTQVVKSWPPCRGAHTHFATGTNTHTNTTLAATCCIGEPP